MVVPKIAYISKRFSKTSKAIIAHAAQICSDYAAQGFDLTLRQLYYQFVSRGLLPNRQSEYKRLGSVVNDARMAGLLDWNYIVDRTREMKERSHWEDPAGIIESAAKSYGIDQWEGQECKVEVWIEKDALIGVIERVCRDLDVPYFSCRGYTSQSEMWRAAKRLMLYARDGGHKPVILHLGDHDPSGIDMTRDIRERLTLFMEAHGFDAVEVKRIALTMQQIQQYNPPPNPAKLTDSRIQDYITEHGYDSWELDALDPVVMSDLIRREVESLMDIDLWTERVDLEEEGRNLLIEASARWSDVSKLLMEGEGE